MVTFRFYVVSTVAFFLALAVGVLVGSVLDGRIADGLQDRLDGVEASLDETVAAMDAKNVQIDEFERYIEASAPFAVQGELEGTSSLVVAESGVDDTGVQDLVRRLRESGSLVEGIVWLEPRWDLAEPEDLTTAATSVGSGSKVPAEVRAAVWQQLLDTATPGTPPPRPRVPLPRPSGRTGRPRWRRRPRPRPNAPARRCGSRGPSCRSWPTPVWCGCRRSMPSCPPTAVSCSWSA